MNSPIEAALWTLYLVLTIYAVFALFPFFWMLLSSFKQQADLFRLAAGIQTKSACSRMTLSRTTVMSGPNAISFVYFRNSVLISSMAAIGQVMTCALAGYAFAKMPLPGKNVTIRDCAGDRVSFLQKSPSFPSIS